MNKQEYFAARASWKASYAQLTADSRAVKAARAETARALSKLGEAPKAYGSPEAKEYWAKHSQLRQPYFEAYSSCIELRQEATKQLEALAVLKADAQRAWLAEREEQAMAA